MQLSVGLWTAICWDFVSLSEADWPSTWGRHSCLPMLRAAGRNACPTRSLFASEQVLQRGRCGLGSGRLSLTFLAVPFAPLLEERKGLFEHLLLLRLHRFQRLGAIADLRLLKLAEAGASRDQVPEDDVFLEA